MDNENSKTDGNFKVPLLISKAINDKTPKSSDETEKAESTSKTNISDSNANAVLPYTEPSWTGTPPENFMFQIIKNGVIISNFQIQKSCIVVGRLTTCDIKLEHPSVSRYHAVLQYCAGNDKYPKGFYIYDLGSTHGTFLNKKQIQMNTYYLVKIDNILKFGGSTRLHIFLGPEEEEEKSECIPKVTEEMSTGDEICSWGIGEDAEEDDLSINPFAISTENEALYIDDPKKTLRGWFEREGYELEYNVEEKGFKTFACSIRLPIDTPTGDYLTVEASVNGKKKEAVVACALEACRTLDRHGLLRQSHHESRERKQKKWEDEDFYDSDEDTYLDRTGTIEKKRQFRMMTVKKPEPETFNSLETKLKDLNDKISLMEEKLQSDSSSSPLESGQNEDDPLDSYLCEMKKLPMDKVTKSKLKLDLAELLKERSRLEKLRNIVKPTEMPVSKFPHMVGKRIKSKLKLPVSRTISKAVPKKDEEPEIEEDEEEEMDQDPETAEKNLVEEVPTSKYTSSRKVQVTEDVSSRIPSSDLPKEEKIEKMNVDVMRIEQTKPSISKPDVQERNTIKHPSPTLSALTSESTCKKARSKKKTKDVYNAADENYSMWMPPVNQSGDGTTHLNSKYGY